MEPIEEIIRRQRMSPAPPATQEGKSAFTITAFSKDLPDHPIVVKRGDPKLTHQLLAGFTDSTLNRIALWVAVAEHPKNIQP